MDYLRRIFDQYCAGAGNLKFVDGIDDFKVIARERGVAEEEIEKYKDNLAGLIVREDRADKNFVILLRKEMPAGLREESIDGLMGQELVPPLDLYSDDSRYLQAFVLLHEIAHYKLSHGSTNDKEEREANVWAINEFPKNLEAIRPQQGAVE